MQRRLFIKNIAAVSIAVPTSLKSFAMHMEKPQTILFKDDGIIPNSKYPLLIYKQAFSQRGNEGAIWLEEKFKSNGWSNSWRWGVYPFHHYHSNTHEVLGCFSGQALLQMGGEQGSKLTVKAGDILIIPAGVGHKCLEHSDDFTVVGAYPEGASADLMKGETDERPAADRRISKVAIPQKDPYSGTGREGLVGLWTA